ncbi:uncharacterized protein PG998_013701 [Apiospora kogelbergensis]|uniref:uncharacterized protein n=1 Tax=Apiospora kogelbergensis TaxID=1337665 RepID=UPI00313112A1
MNKRQETDDVAMETTTDNFSKADTHAKRHYMLTTPPPSRHGKVVVACTGRATDHVREEEEYGNGNCIQHAVDISQPHV